MASIDGIEKVAVDRLEHTDDVDHTKDARIAAEAEHATTLWQALKENRKAAFWSVMLSTTVIMEGYDVGELPSYHPRSIARLI